MIREESIEVIRKACVAANPALGAVPAPYPERDDVRDALVSLAKIVALNHVTREHVETASALIEAHRQQAQREYIAQLRGDYRHEITLPDILLALGNLSFVEYEGGGRSDPRNISVTTEGLLVNENGMVLATIDLRAPLSGQTDEAVLALAKLLKPNDTNDARD